VDYERYNRLESQVRAVERSTLLRMRNENKVNDQVLRTMESELDILDTRFVSSHH
jgi:CPA1 family monovalent cation:H+ antiporter